MRCYLFSATAAPHSAAWSVSVAKIGNIFQMRKILVQSCIKYADYASIKVGISHNSIVNGTNSHTTPHFWGYGRAEYQQNAVLFVGAKGSNFAM